MASQVLIYALFALSINMMLGYGGMVSLGHAGYLGLAGYACILLVINGFDQLSAAILALVFSTAMAGLFGMLSLRAPGLGFIMITLALGQIVWGIAYRANNLTGGDNGIRLPERPAPFGIDITSAPRFYWFTLARARRRILLHLALLALAVRRKPDGRTRPAAPHVDARPQRLADPLADLRDGGLLGLGREPAVRLLQPVPQPARARPPAVRRDPADGHSRRRQLADRSDRRRGDHHADQERGLVLRRALEHAARRDLRGGHRVHAVWAGARLPDAVAENHHPQQTCGDKAHRDQDSADSSSGGCS